MAKRESIRKWFKAAIEKFWNNRLLVFLGIVCLYLLGVIGNWALYPEAARILDTGFKDKTLWDWIGLLIVPLVLVVGVFFLNSSQRMSKQEIATESLKQDWQIAEQNRGTDRIIARDRQYQATLETYFDRMTALILENGLGTTKAKKGVQRIACTRTLTVLRSLNAERVAAVFRFIVDAELNDVISLAKGDLREVNWKWVDLVGANLSGAVLAEAVLINANLSNADLSGADLSGAKLFDANLRGANLVKANLSGAFLRGADLLGATLSGANLSGANLRDADLSDTDLSDADLIGTILEGAALGGANLQGVILRGANLVGAKNYTDKQLSEAQSLEDATMPDGTKYEE